MFILVSKAECGKHWCTSTLHIEGIPVQAHKVVRVHLDMQKKPSQVRITGTQADPRKQN